MIIDRKAHVVGLGLIGTSLALALRDANWEVSGWDIDATVREQARDRGVPVTTQFEEADLVVVCVPAGSVVEVVAAASKEIVKPSALITDVAGVKSAIVSSVSDFRFIGGHPMAGSELRGPMGADLNLFKGCSWILTPSSATTPEQYSRLHTILRELGASVVAIEPDQHDRLMSIASHVPHLVAGALMNEAAETSQHDAVLLQLAAGGFRDMTRIAAGDPIIWPDVLIENRTAVTSTLDAVISRLQSLQKFINDGDRAALTGQLREASSARRELPGRATQSDQLAYLRVELSDEPGQLARVTLTASELLVNIYDIEISHAAEETFGTLLVTIESTEAERFSLALTAAGFKVGIA